MYPLTWPLLQVIMGKLYKQLDFTEDRSTGVPTIQEKLATNGSPRATS